MHDNEGLKELALNTLGAICENPEAPASAKASAARTILEALRVLGSKADSRINEKSADQMTLEELNAEIREIEGKLLKQNINPVTGKPAV